MDDKFENTCLKIIQRYGQEWLSKSPLNKYGWTALHAACYYGRVSAVIYLIENAKVNCKLTNENGWDPLIFTVMGSSLTSVSNEHVIASRN